MSDSKKTFMERYQVRILLTLLVLIGILGVSLFEPEGRLPLKFVEHFSMAVAVSGIIGLLIEFTLQQDLARNVFEAAIGYLLPEELRSELRWIYGLELVCERHDQVVRLEPIPGTSLVRIKVSFVRTLRNHTDLNVELPVGLGIGEWFYKDHPSKIVSLRYQEEGEESVELVGRVKKGDASLTITLDPLVVVGGGKKIVVSSEYEETMMENDWTFVGFSFPTVNPLVTIYAPEELEAKAIFDHREKKKALTQKGPHAWQLDGVLLPHQDIRIHWYKKSDNKTWLEN